jgi:uncharacterized membrane protein
MNRRRACFLVSTIVLAAGLAAREVGYPTLGGRLIGTGLVLLAVVPVIGIVSALVGYIRTREWRFVAVSVAVIVLLALSVSRLLFD